MADQPKPPSFLPGPPPQTLDEALEDIGDPKQLVEQAFKRAKRQAAMMTAITMVPVCAAAYWMYAIGTHGSVMVLAMFGVGKLSFDLVAAVDSYWDKRRRKRENVDGESEDDNDRPT